MFNWFKKKHVKQQELYPGVPTTDGTNDFLDLYSKTNRKDLPKILSTFKQQVVEKAFELTLCEFNSYKYSLVIDDIKNLSYSIKAIEILVRLTK